MIALQPLKPVDVVVGLRLAEGPELKYDELSADLGISSSTAHAAVRRLQAAGLLRPSSRVVNWLALHEFLAHGLRYAFPARPGARARGVPTAHAGPPLAKHIVAEDMIVWPDPEGPVEGEAIAPLYPQAIELPKRAPATYEMLTLADAIRVGGPRERQRALEEIQARVRSASARPRMRDEIVRLRGRILEAAAENGAGDVRLFGSVARGDDTSGSDIDFLVSLEPGRTLLDLTRLEVRLEELLQHPADVVTPESLRESIRATALREAVPV
ncbi:MAG TPA: nucleotidyltransferase domain-containing protein [Gemmatimonadales bacterium]|nr:nucleotidyltransferase domain-containing protein [Gemmatimonadales bacterium]